MLGCHLDSMCFTNVWERETPISLELYGRHFSCLKVESVKYRYYEALLLIGFEECLLENVL